MGRRIGESSKGGRQNIDWKRIGQWEGLWATFEFIFQIYSSSEIDCFDYFWVFWDFVGIFISAQLLSRVQLFVTPGHTRSPCPSPTPGVYPNSCPLSRCCHPTILSSVIHFSSCLQSFPASGSFPVSQIFTSGGQSIGVLSVLPVNIQDWFPLGWTGLSSLQSKGLSRVFSNTTVQKHQFFGAQLSL